MSKNNVVILEGPRCSGKTTLALLLAKDGFTYLRFEKQNEVPAIKFQRERIEEILRIPGNYVIDRFHLTELVYRTYDGTTPFKQLIWNTHEINTLLKMIHARIFVLLAPPDVLMQRVALAKRENDIHPLISIPLWMMASALDNVTMMHNEDKWDMEKIRQYILSKGKVKA